MAGGMKLTRDWQLSTILWPVNFSIKRSAIGWISHTACFIDQQNAFINYLLVLVLLGGLFDGWTATVPFRLSQFLSELLFQSAVCCPATFLLPQRISLSVDDECGGTCSRRTLVFRYRNGDPFHYHDHHNRNNNNNLHYVNGCFDYLLCRTPSSWPLLQRYEQGGSQPVPRRKPRGHSDIVGI